MQLTLFQPEQVRLSPRVILRRGDRLRISGGPIYTTADGVNLRIGERGRYRFIRAETADYILCRPERETAAVLVYVGQVRPGTVDGVTLKPHRVRKVRAK